MGSDDDKDVHGLKYRGEKILRVGHELHKVSVEGDNSMHTFKLTLVNNQ